MRYVFCVVYACFVVPGLVMAGGQARVAHEPARPAVLSDITWGGETKTTNLVEGAGKACFVFAFTNYSPSNVTIQWVNTSCGCTTAQLPPLPWTIGPGESGQFGVTMNIQGKSGTISKIVTVAMKNSLNMLDLKTLTVIANVIPLRKLPSITPQGDRAQNLAMASADRQAVFQGNCANCHVLPAHGKYGKELYDTACGICHESKHRATMVPNLHNIPQSTDLKFWHTWITYGRPHSLMPAFAIAEGGPLNDSQIASLEDYLVAAFPSASRKVH